MPVKIFLGVKVKSGKAKGVLKNLRVIDDIELVCTVSDGLYDIVAMIEVPSLEDYRTFSIDKVGSIPNIDDYTSFIIMDE